MLTRLKAPAGAIEAAKVKIISVYLNIRYKLYLTFNLRRHSAFSAAEAKLIYLVLKIIYFSALKSKIFAKNPNDKFSDSRVDRS